MSLLTALPAAATAALLFSPQAQAQVDAERCKQLLRNLDELHNAGELEEYLARFVAEQTLLHDVHARHLQARMAYAQSSNKALVRQSQLLSQPHSLGEHTILGVTYQTSWSDGSGSPMSEHGFLVVREANGQLVPVLAIETPPKIAATLGQANNPSLTGGLSCPPCNYQIGPAAGWLCVPVPHTRSHALDAATFLLLGTDIAIDLSVRIGPADETATVMVDRLLDKLLDHAPDGDKHMTQPWLPSSLKDRRPRGLTGAMAIADLPDDQRTVIYGTALGRLHHLLLLRGDREAQERHRATIDRLLGSFQLVGLDDPDTDHATRSLNHHSGGHLTKNGNFLSQQHQIRIDGPRGWHPTLRSAGCVFQVRWESPDHDGRLWFSGHRPPSTSNQWTRRLADRWVDRFVANIGQVVEDSDWSDPDAHGQRGRELVLGRDERPTAETGMPMFTQRRLRLLLRQDLFLIADGYVAPDEDPAPVLLALRSMRRPPN
ncbi:MAG: hypothetical protein VYE77_04820 [Planctomycetota bacterium]|nr:hypothetical protein [Planctomycetota bacterium]